MKQWKTKKFSGNMLVCAFVLLALCPSAGPNLQDAKQAAKDDHDRMLAEHVASLTQAYGKLEGGERESA